MMRKNLWTRMGRFLVILLVLITILSRPVSDSSAQEGWSKPTMLGKGWFPDITSDITGRVHIVWASEVQLRDVATPVPPTPIAYNGYDQVMYTYTQDGSHFSEVNDISAVKQDAGTEATRPSIMADPNGNLHISYREIFLYYLQASIASAEQATSWRAPYQINSQNVGYFSRMARNPDGTLYMVFTENVISQACMICYHLYFTKSSDNGYNWTLKQDISVLPTGAAKPQVLVDSKNVIHVVWEAGDGGAYGQLADPTTIMYTSSTDQGAHWTRPVEFFLPNGESKNVTIGQDGEGNLVVAWLGLPENKVYYQVSSDQGQSWSQPQPFPNLVGGWDAYPARLDDYSMATDSAGNIHLALVGKLSESERTLDVLHVVWNGSAWEKPEVVTSLVGDVPEWPRLSISDGNQLNVAWFVRDQKHIFNSDKGDYHVWYARGAAEAPTVAPGVLPTPTTGITPSPTQPVYTPTPTPVDPSFRTTPIRDDLAGSIYTEQDKYVTMGLALVPAAAIMLLVLAVTRMRHH